MKILLLPCLLLAIPCTGALASESMGVDCSTSRQGLELVQKGMFALAVPTGAAESKRDSPDSLFWVWKTGSIEISVDFGFVPADGARGKFLSLPCGKNGKGRLKFTQQTGQGAQVFMATFRSPVEPMRELVLKIRSQDGLTPQVTAIASSLQWTGDIAKLRLISIDASRKMAAFDNETGVPFIAGVGDFVSHRWGTLKAVRENEVDVEEYVYIAKTGDFIPKCYTLKLGLKGPPISRP